jgi:hypothetical protein
LQALISFLMFLHKAIRPARLFVNILALLRSMGDAAEAAIDEDAYRDLQWFVVCSQAVNSSILCDFLR